MRANAVSQKWDSNFLDILMSNVTELIEYSATNGNVFISLLFETYGGQFYKNDPNKEYSALPFRDASMALVIQVFYIDGNGKDYATTALGTLFNEYIINSWNNEDIRMWGYTFDELNMKKELKLNYYRDSSVFKRLSHVKSTVDKCNIFSNKFTMLLTDNPYK